MAIQNSDAFLVARNGTNYQTSASNIMAIQDTDLLVVNRGGTNYKVTGLEVKDFTGGVIGTPFIYSPAEGSTGVSGLSSAISSDFEAELGLTHESSTWQVERVSDGALIKNETSTLYLQSYPFSDNVYLNPTSYLQVNTQYRVRVRYNSSAGSSQFSQWTTFTTASSWPGPGPYPAPSGYARIGSLIPGTAMGSVDGLYPIVFSPTDGYYYFVYDQALVIKTRDFNTNYVSLESPAAGVDLGSGLQVLPWMVAAPFGINTGPGAASPRTGFQAIHVNGNPTTRTTPAGDFTYEGGWQLNTLVSPYQSTTNIQNPGCSAWAVNPVLREALWSPSSTNLLLYEEPNYLTGTVVPGLTAVNAVGYNPALDIWCYQQSGDAVNFTDVIYIQGWANPLGTEVGRLSLSALRSRAFSPNIMAGDQGNLYAYSYTRDNNFYIQKFAGSTGAGYTTALSLDAVAIPGGWLTVSLGQPIFYTANQAFTRVDWPQLPGAVWRFAVYVNNQVILGTEDGLYVPVF